MNTAAQAIEFSLTMSQRMLDGFAADLKGDDWLHRPCEKGNCAAWLVGHLVMSERRALGGAGVTDLPPLPEGFEKRFARDAESPMAKEFGDTSILIPLLDRHRAMLVERVSKLSPADLDKPMPQPNARFKTVGEMLSFMPLHTMMHAGHISTIRRTLGRPPLN